MTLSTGDLLSALGASGFKRSGGRYACREVAPLPLRVTSGKAATVTRHARCVAFAFALGGFIAVLTTIALAGAHGALVAPNIFCSPWSRAIRPVAS